MTEGEAKLVRMAGEIHQFFRHQGDIAAEKAADHMRQFWPPTMRADLTALAQKHSAAIPPEIRAIVAELAD